MNALEFCSKSISKGWFRALFVGRSVNSGLLLGDYALNVKVSYFFCRGHLFPIFLFGCI